MYPYSMDTISYIQIYRSEPGNGLRNERNTMILSDPYTYTRPIRISQPLSLVLFSFVLLPLSDDVTEPFMSVHCVLPWPRRIHLMRVRNARNTCSRDALFSTGFSKQNFKEKQVFESKRQLRCWNSIFLVIFYQQVKENLVGTTKNVC